MKKKKKIALTFNVVERSIKKSKKMMIEGEKKKEQSAKLMHFKCFILYEFIKNIYKKTEVHQ